MGARRVERNGKFNPIPSLQRFIFISKSTISKNVWRPRVELRLGQPEKLKRLLSIPSIGEVYQRLEEAKHAQNFSLAYARACF